MITTTAEFEQETAWEVVVLSLAAPLMPLASRGVNLDLRSRAVTIQLSGLVLGVALLSWQKSAVRKGFIGWSLLWPIVGAVARGLAQVGAKAGLLIWTSPFAASLIGYVVSSATVVGADRLRRSKKHRLTGKGLAWFVGTGILNGCAVLLMYAALSIAPVWTVAPIVASHPLITAILGSAVLHDEKLSLHTVAGATITVAAVVYLVSSHAGA